MGRKKADISFPMCSFFIFSKMKTLLLKKFFKSYSQFTVLCQFLLYSKVTQSFLFLYYLLSWSSPKRLALAPCAVQ